MKTQKQIIKEVLKELRQSKKTKDILLKEELRDDDIINYGILGMNITLKLQREDELKFLKSLIGRPIFIQNIKDRIKELEKET